MKVERVSYDVITPSAARAIFTAIFWKPAIRWHVRKIEVLKPIAWTSVRRNEVRRIATPNSSGMFVEDERQQRAGLFLRDVGYCLHGTMEFVPPPHRPKVTRPVSEVLINADERVDWPKEENPAKYYAMFERRARKGQCFNQPYLGCREFTCDVRYVSEEDRDGIKPIDETRDLGFMLYDLDYTDEADPKPAFFRPQMVRGVIDVPSWDSDEVRK